MNLENVTESSSKFFKEAIPVKLESEISWFDSEETYSAKKYLFGSLILTTKYFKTPENLAFVVLFVVTFIAEGYRGT